MAPMAAMWAAVKKAADNAACQDYLPRRSCRRPDGCEMHYQHPRRLPENEWVNLVTRQWRAMLCNQPPTGGKVQDPAAP